MKAAITPPALPDLVSGLGIALWYALPDYTRDRRIRAGVKAGIIASSALYGIHVLKSREASGTSGCTPVEELQPKAVGPDAAGVEAAGETRSRTGLPRHPVVLALAAVALLGSTAVGTIGMERVVYRYGEKLTGRGVRLAHTRIGVVLAVLSTVTTVAGYWVRDRNRQGRAPAGSTSVD